MITSDMSADGNTYGSMAKSGEGVRLISERYEGSNPSGPTPQHGSINMTRQEENTITLERQSCSCSCDGCDPPMGKPRFHCGSVSGGCYM
jgi:hypothetical protein